MIVATVLDRLVAAAGTAISTPALVLTTYDYVPDKVEVPCVYAALQPIDFDRTMNRATDEMVVILTVLCSRASDREGQRMLYGYLNGGGPASIKAAVEAARGVPGVGALAGACDDFRVERVSEPRKFTHAGEEFLGAEFTVRIWGDGA